MRWFMVQLSLLIIATTLSGCCTYLTVDTATHAFLHDRVQRIEKAAITPEDKLVILVEGTVAESTRVKPYTITCCLPTDDIYVRVPREGMMAGWEPKLLNSEDTRPVTVAPAVVIPAYESVRGNRNHLLRVPGAEKTLYLVQHEKPDKITDLFYVGAALKPREIDFYLDGRDVKTPRHYPFLLLVPLTIAVDAATLPFQVYFLSTLGDKRPPVVKK